MNLETKVPKLGGVEDQSSVELLAQNEQGKLSAGVDERLSSEGERGTDDEGRLRHLLVNFAPVERLEFVPLGRDDDGGGTLAGLEGRLGDGDLLLVCKGNTDDASDLVLWERTNRRKLTSVDVGSLPLGKVVPDLLLLHLRVVHTNVGALGKEVVDQVDGGRLPGVSGVFLKGEPAGGARHVKSKVSASLQRERRREGRTERQASCW